MQYPIPLRRNSSRYLKISNIKFLGPTESLPVIIASDLVDAQEEKLLDVLREHKEAIGWTIEDIKRISPSVVMHKIHLKENAKPSREPQEGSTQPCKKL